MGLIGYIVISLAGAALLAFLAAWFWQKNQIDGLDGEVKEIQLDLKDEQSAFGRLQAESEAQKLSIENLHKLMQSLEAQNLELEQRAKMAEHDSEGLLDEKHRLMAEIDSLLKENENLREASKITLDGDVGTVDEMDLRIKAKKLVRAFKKGFQEEGELPPSNS